MFGEQRFVGGDDIFSCIEQLEHDGTCRLDPANQMRNHFNFWVLENAVQIVRQNAFRELDAPILVQVANGRLF